MSDYNRTEQLKSIHQSKKEKSIKKVQEAITNLKNRNENITFINVALESGVARSTLYRNQEIKALIESNISNETDEIHKLKEQIKQLTIENNKLKSMNMNN